MIERLARALERVEELPEDVQEKLAAQIEAYTVPRSAAADNMKDRGNLAGSMPDLPDDAEETLLRWRREARPTPLIGDQLDWLDDE